MLKGIPEILSPELLKVLCEMGHSDRLVIADGNFPVESMGKNAITIRCDGHGVPEILDAILKLFPLALHSTMFLLIRLSFCFPVSTIYFTFHDVSINTGFLCSTPHSEECFTFHDVSINTEFQFGLLQLSYLLYIPRCFY